MSFSPLFREDLDAQNHPGRRARSGALSDGEITWLQTRLDLQRRLGLPCTDIRIATRAPKERVPPLSAPALVADIPDDYVCPQLRLYSVYVFTDDPQFAVVGVALAMLAIQVWRSLTLKLGALMAIDEKRSLGSWCPWDGVVLVFSLGIVIVPKNKLLRAIAAVEEALSNTLTFDPYRSLCGLLEHLRAIVLCGRNVMHGLYRPHADRTLAAQGSNSIVRCDPLWRSSYRAGASSSSVQAE